MNRFLIGLLLVAGALLPGCEDSHQRDAGGTIAVDERNADVGNKRGVSVKLPGVEINVNEETGVDVKAPGTDVSVRKDGIDITAPNVDIKTRPKATSNE